MQTKVRKHANKISSRWQLQLLVIMLVISKSDIGMSSEPNPHQPEQEQVFLAKCTESLAHIITTQSEIGAWLDAVTIAYATAWDNHTKVLSAAKETRNKPLSKVDLLSMAGEIVEFVPASGASIISKVIVDLSKEDSILIEAAKEIIENNGGLTVSNGINTYRIPNFTPPGNFDITPQSPIIKSHQIRERLNREMSIVSRQVETWLRLYNDRKNIGTPFDISFDPAQEIKKRMKLRGISASNLPKVDKDALAIYFEKSFWAKWLSSYGYVSRPQNFFRKFLSGFGCIEESLITQEIKQRCLAIGLPMEKYINIAYLQAESECNSISPSDKYTIKDYESQKWYRTDK